MMSISYPCLNPMDLQPEVSSSCVSLSLSRRSPPSTSSAPTTDSAGVSHIQAT